MSGKQIESVEVVATLLVQGKKILAVFNPRWGAFTFPMSRRKFFKDSDVSEAATPEKLDRAAARVAAEALGRSFPPDDFPTLLVEIKNFEQSDADGIWKLYTIHVFSLKVSEGVRLAPGVITEWLTPKELQTREPVTHTARYILRESEKQGLTPSGRR
ncbi:MAG: hypothetical protein ACLQVY_04945 [Limisphaerales bacterium]